VSSHPFFGIEIAKIHFGFHTIAENRHFLGLIGLKSIVETGSDHTSTAVDNAIQSTVVHASPVHEVGGTCNGMVRTEDVVSACACIDYGRVVNTHSAMTLVSAQLSHLGSGYCGLCLHGK